MFLSKNSNGIWHLYYNKVDGKRTKVSTKTKLKNEAVDFLRAFKLDKKEKPKNLLIEDFTREFLPFVEKTFSRGNTNLYIKSLSHFKCFFGNISLKAISPFHWDKYKILRQNNEEKSKALSPTSVNIELRCLKAALNTAVRWNFIEVNPFSRLKQLSVPEQTPIFFTKVELQALWSSIEQVWLKEIVLFAVMTGMRQGEILNLRWCDIDFSGETIQIQNSVSFKIKTGKRRVIPMNKMIYVLLLQKHSIRSGDLVFTVDGNVIKREMLSVKFKRAIKTAGINNPKLHFHSLRHTFASWLVQSGVSLYEVQKLLGHTTSAVTQIYSHLLPNQMHSTVNKISLDLDKEL